MPADGWYEWAKRLDSPTKQPYFVTPQDGSVLAFAGLWEVWGRGDDRLYTCTVVTAPAVGALTEIHERMPLVLPPDRWAAWLDPAREDVEALVEPTPPELVETLRAPPGEHRGEQRGEQRPRADWPGRSRSASPPTSPPSSEGDAPPAEHPPLAFVRAVATMRAVLRDAQVMTDDFAPVDQILTPDG